MILPTSSTIPVNKFSPLPAFYGMFKPYVSVFLSFIFQFPSNQNVLPHLLYPLTDQAIRIIGMIHAHSCNRKGNSARLKIEAEKVLEDIKIGDSIAVNGICLTVTSFGKNYFTADVMHETLRRSSIGEAASGSPVNLERAMAANGRFGGHIVTGHIDGTGTICEVI